MKAIYYLLILFSFLFFFTSCEHCHCGDHGPSHSREKADDGKKYPEKGSMEYKEMLHKAEPKIDKIMEMMDLPEYGLLRMSKEGLYLSKDYYNAAADMMKWGYKMKEVSHPEKKFMEMNDNMLKAFDGFKVALDSKDKNKIAASWKIVCKTCTDCHEEFE